MKNKWDDVTLDEFIELAKIEVDAELLAMPLKRAKLRIMVLSDMKEEELENLTGSEFGNLITEVKFTDDEPEFDQLETFKIGEVEYGYRGSGELSTGEYISVELAIADARRTKTSALPDLLGVLIRPVERVHDPEFGEKIVVEKFITKKHKPRVAKFRKELTVPFFINALTRIMGGENGIKQAIASYMNTDSTTSQGKK